MRQKGFTLIEILVAMAVGGILMVGVVFGIFQVSWGSLRSNDQVVALTDVNYAALRLKKDLQMAHTTGMTVGGSVVLSPENTVTLGWTDYTSSFEPEDADKTHFSIYSFTDSGELVRTYDGTPRCVGRHITYLRFTREEEMVVNVVITATGPGVSQRSETLEFSVHMRSWGLPE